MTEADGKDGEWCGCGGWVDYASLQSIMLHEHRGLAVPVPDIKGVKVSP